MTLEYPCVHFEDGKCKKFSDEKTTSFCVMGPCEFETPSNGDHIRGMSDKELELFIQATTINAMMLYKIYGVQRMKPDNVLDWLKQPYKGGEDDEQTD